MQKDLVDFLLSDFRRSPGMFLGIYSISKLSIFITGFEMVRWKYDTAKTATSYFYQFQEWFNLKHAIEFTSFWHTPFLDLTNEDEKAALDLFFKELELFVKETPHAEEE